MAMFSSLTLKFCSSLVMEKTALTLLIIASLLISVTVGRCKWDYDKNGCVKKVTCLDIDVMAIPEKRVFIIYYRNQGAEEIVAACDWVRSGNLGCDDAEGYTCDVRPNKNFSFQINTATKCLKEGQFLFDVARKSPISCDIENSQKTLETECNPAETQDNTDCSNGSPDDYQNENGANSIAIELVIAIGSSIATGSLAVVAAFTALPFIRNRQRLQKLWRSVVLGNKNDIKPKDQTEAQRPVNPSSPYEALQNEIKEPTDQEKRKDAVIDFHSNNM